MTDIATPIIIRFVRSIGLSSDGIVALEKTAMPFTPSHVEAVTPDGFYLGAHFEGGTMKRPKNYDAGQFSHELFLTLDATDVQGRGFYGFLNGHIGEPYDWEAILGFLLPEHEHIPNHAICSALVSLALRACNWFASPLAAPAHLIDPRDLLLIISGRMVVPMG
jgi:hypothetical protein